MMPPRFPQSDFGTDIGQLADYVSQLPPGARPQPVTPPSPTQPGSFGVTPAQAQEFGKHAAETSPEVMEKGKTVVESARPFLPKLAGEFSEQLGKNFGRALTPVNMWRMAQEVQNQLGKNFDIGTPGTGTTFDKWKAIVSSLWGIAQSPEDMAKLSPEARMFVSWIGSKGVDAALMQFGITGGKYFPIAGGVADAASSLRGRLRELSEKRLKAFEAYREPSRQNEPLTPTDIQRLIRH
jgi:hypothetical protein